MLPVNPFTQTVFDLADDDEAVLLFPRSAAPGKTAPLCRSPATSRPLAADDYGALANRADEATALLKVLCNESRLTIFQLIVDRPMTVGEISLRTSKPQNDVSMNLEKLRKASLVQFKRYGRFRYYFVPDNSLTLTVLSILQRFEAVKHLST